MGIRIAREDGLHVTHDVVHHGVPWLCTRVGDWRRREAASRSGFGRGGWGFEEGAKVVRDENSLLIKLVVAGGTGDLRAEVREKGWW